MKKIWVSLPLICQQFITQSCVSDDTAVIILANYMHTYSKFLSYAGIL